MAKKAKEIAHIELTSYEQEQFDAVKTWTEAEPGIVTQTLGKVAQPLGWLVSKLIPQKAIEGALNMADRLAEFMTDTKDIIRDGKVTSVGELRHKGLEISDGLANTVHNWAMTVAFAEGTAAGTGGVLTIIVDVPTLIVMCLRVIHKIGICYGYECKTEMDQKYILSVLAAAGANTMKEKVAAVTMLQRINVMIATTSWKKLARDKSIVAVAITMIRNLAKQLGINISKRKAAQIIPILGATVGGAMNAAMLNDVAWAARRMFQQRWLLENKKISESMVS